MNTGVACTAAAITRAISSLPVRNGERHL
jgi:hypothetical protein